MSQSTRLQPDEIGHLISRLEEAVQLGLVVPIAKPRNTQAAYRGAGKYLPSNWNVLVYEPRLNSNDPSQSVVCVDFLPLRSIWKGDWISLVPSDKEPVVIDDAGWGFPLLGCMVGLYRPYRIKAEAISVKYFQGDAMTDKAYLAAYAEVGLRLLNGFGVSQRDNRVEICPGWVNTALKDQLREAGWETRVVRVTGPLQGALEPMFADMVVRETGADIYYDPKVMPKREIPGAYQKALDYGQQNCPELLKTGWKSMQAEPPNSETKV